MSRSKKKYRPDNLKLFKHMDDNDIGILNKYYTVDIDYENPIRLIYGGSGKKLYTTQNKNILLIEGLHENDITKYIRYLSFYFDYKDILNLKLKIPLLYRYHSTYYIQNIIYTYHFKSETIYPNLYSLNSLELTDYNIIVDLVETLAEFIFISQKIGYVCNEFEILYSVVDDNFYYIDYDECFTSTYTAPNLDLLPSQYHDLFIDTYNNLTSTYNLNK